MRTICSAWKSFHEVLGILDPWLALPALASMTAGLQKQVCVPARPRVGLSIVMLKNILAYMDVNETHLWHVCNVTVAFWLIETGR